MRWKRKNADKQIKHTRGTYRVSKLPIRESSIGIGPLIKLLDRLLQTVKKRNVILPDLHPKTELVIFKRWQYLELTGTSCFPDHEMQMEWFHSIYSRAHFCHQILVQHPPHKSIQFFKSKSVDDEIRYLQAIEISARTQVFRYGSFKSVVSNISA